jgi:adenylylsulfate kinase
MSRADPNLRWHEGSVARADREARLAQTAMTLWFTGLSASGKSTLAFALEQALTQRGRACYVLDGDNVRHGLNRDLGFSAQDRSENIRRVAEVARLMNDAGLIVITSFISPFAADRERARQIVGVDHFREVYVSTPFTVCEQRDPKGLYARAKAGNVADFTGVSSPYEPPLQPDIEIDTQVVSVEAAIDRLMTWVGCSPGLSG